MGMDVVRGPVLKLAVPWNHPGSLKRTVPGSHPQSFCFVGLECSLGIGGSGGEV